MECLEKPLKDLSPQEIATALKAAIPMRDVTVTADAELNGAIAEACCVEVYVLLDAQHDTISVQCCQAHSCNPYKTLTASTLDEAMTAVVTEFDNVSWAAAASVRRPTT